MKARRNKNQTVDLLPLVRSDSGGICNVLHNPKFALNVNKHLIKCTIKDRL